MRLCPAESNRANVFRAAAIDSSVTYRIKSFAAAQGDPTVVSDLGSVSGDVATAAGFDCPEVKIG